MDPSHITEFASNQYFAKLKQLDQNAENAATSSSAGPSSTTTENASSLQSAQQKTFVLPLGRQRTVEDELPPLALRPSDQKKRSLGHDLTGLRTQRRPIFSGSLGRLRSKVSVTQKTPSIVEHHEEILAEDPTASQALTLSDLFLTLPNELQAQIISPLSVHTILTLRLVSKTFHTLVTLNEASIARYHITYSLPKYTLRLYPVPESNNLNLHYLCSIWHRLHVASKLANMITSQATKEIFLRKTEFELKEFEPQSRRMRMRLMPLVFTLFHFFETYRDLHVQRLSANDIPLHMQPFTFNPIESQIMASYDDRTLLKVHQVFPLVISSFSRRLRPPSYAGRLERSIKGYHKDRPPDEVYATILAVGGLRQAMRFWETKGYNARRNAVDLWYSFVTRTPVEATPSTASSKFSKIAHFGRKKEVVPSSESSSNPLPSGHAETSCNEWFCVKPTCQAAKRRHSTDNLVFHSSLAAGPPMSPLSREQLRLVLPDLQNLHQIWMNTAEALILERNIVERAQDIKRNSQVLFELINPPDDNPDEDWISDTPEPPRNVIAEPQEGMGPSTGLSD